MRRKLPRDPAHRYVKATDRMEAAERKLAAAFNAWIKARKDVRAANRKLDELQSSSSAT
jgi:hypothetical protein